MRGNEHTSNKKREKMSVDKEEESGKRPVKKGRNPKGMAKEPQKPPRKPKEEPEEEDYPEDDDLEDEEDLEDEDDEEEEEEKPKPNPKKGAKPNKAGKADGEEKDYFWMKVLIVTIVIIWGSLFAGSWAGNYLLESKLFAKKTAADSGDPKKPKVWKTVIEEDEKGGLSKTAVLTDNTDELKIDDFRNIDDPIPGIDDQSLKKLDPQSILPIQEPVPSNDPTPDQSGAPQTPEPSGTEPASQSVPTPDSTQSPAPEIPHPPLDETANAGTQTGESGVVEKVSNSLLPPEGSYNIQIGAFSSEENAGKMADELKAKGHETVIERVSIDGKDSFKVKIIEKDSKESAAKKADELKSEGYDAIVVPR